MTVAMTGEQLILSFTELRKAFEVALNHVEATAGTGSAALDQDYFWSIPAEELYDVYDVPVNMTIGQLSESWQHLRDSIADPDRVLTYDLVWLADVLRAIGQSNPR
ncbi:hypothetical protein [Nocardia sp. NPDC049149]|uniref:hypothetical protein n=1 Tax=Nocardia sp. NPDC049149 TaxID=3364315 RepID=UPI00371ADE19